LGVKQNYFLSLEGESTPLALALDAFETTLMKIDELGGDSKVSLGESWFNTLFGWYSYLNLKIPTLGNQGTIFTPLSRASAVSLIPKRIDQGRMRLVRLLNGLVTKCGANKAICVKDYLEKL
jgi:hypothetical protein